MSRTEYLGLVLSQGEKQLAKQLAEDDGGLSLAASIRRLIRAEAKRRGLWLPHQQPASAVEANSAEGDGDFRGEAANVQPS